MAFENYEDIREGDVIEIFEREEVLFTDDLEMKAVSDRYSTEEKVAGTLEASVDVALACHDPELQLDLFAAAVRLQEQRRSLERAAVDASRRLQAVRTWLASDRPSPAGLDVVGCSEHRDLALRLRAEGGEAIG